MHARRWLFASLLALAGCGGGGGSSSSGAIVDVEPKELVRGRTMTLTVIGDATSWSSNLGPDDVEIRTRDGQIDPAIDVLFVNVANEQYLTIDVEVAPSALRDRRDLVVAGERLDGVLRVEPPFEIVEATTIAPGHVIQLGIQGRGTDWIPTAVTVRAPSSPEIQLEGTLALPYDYGAGGVQYTSIPLGATVLRHDFLYVTLYAPWYTPGGAIDLEIRTPASVDSFPAALEMPVPTFETLTPGTPTLGSLDAPLATKLYRAPIAAFQDCDVSLLNGTPSQEVTFLVFNPNVPEAAWSFGGEDDGSYDPYLAFTPQDLVIAVMDLATLGGGDSWDFVLDFQCGGYAPQPLGNGVALAGQTLATPGEYKYYRIAPSRWTYSTVTITPQTALPDFVGYIEPFGAFDRPVTDDYAYGDNTGIGAVEVVNSSSYAYSSVFTTGTREAAVYLYDYYYNVGADSEFTIRWDESPIPGTLYDTTSGPLAIPDAQFALDPTAYVESTIQVTANTPGIVRLALDVRHTWVGDLVIELTAPNGKKAKITDWSNYGGNDMILVYPDIYGIGTGYQGYEDTLDALATPSPLGTWTLRVYDAFPEGTGVLNGWAITVE